MADVRSTIRENIKRLGYANNRHVRLYGQSFLLVSDPIVEGERIAFVEGVEFKTRSVRRIPIPLPIVMIAQQSVRA